MRAALLPCHALRGQRFAIVFVVGQLWFILAAQRCKLRLPDALDLGLVDKLLLGYVVPVRRLWAVLSFRYKSVTIR